MKKAHFVVIIQYLLFKIRECRIITNDKDTTASALANVCDEFFLKSSEEFSVIIYGPASDRMCEILNEFLSIIESEAVIRLEYVKNPEHWHHEMKMSAVLFISDELDVWKFTKSASLTNMFPRNLKFLVYSGDFMNSYQFHRKYNTDLTFVQSHQYFLMDMPDEISLLTIEHFGDGYCNKPSINTLNIFNKSRKSWDMKLQNHQKFRNFHTCQLEIFETFGPFLYAKEKVADVSDCVKSGRRNCSSLIAEYSGDANLQGITLDIFKIMSKIANFSTNFNFLLGDLAEYRNEVNPAIRLHYGQLTLVLNSEVFSTVSVYNGHYLFALTPAELYTNFEKLWLPFDDFTWIFLLFTFVAAFSAIFVVKFMNVGIRHAFFGRENTTPSWNIIHIFFGISHLKIPKASIPRFILILFILFCLIFRTCYQSKLFEFMTSDMRKPPPKSIEDLIIRDYTIVTCSEGQNVALNRIIEEKR